jgi:hypothetical protein
LKRLGNESLARLPGYQRRGLQRKRYEKQRPGHQLQVDVKFIEPLGKKEMRAKVLSIHRHRSEVNSLLPVEQPTASSRRALPACFTCQAPMRTPNAGDRT